MPLKPVFHPFEVRVEECFARAKADGGTRVANLALQIEEEPYGKGSGRAEFLVFDPAGPVRVTWNAIASLWAFAQGAARLSRRMFEGARSGRSRLVIKDDRELEIGLDSYVLAHRFCEDTPPDWASSKDHWPAWAPKIDPTAPTGSDNDTGNRLFLGALAWIFRHELAHVALDHEVRQKAGELTTTECETEADLEATRWYQGTRHADPYRVAGALPAQNELELEWRAIALGLGLIWVALFEADRAQLDEDHPPPAERLFACLEQLKMREDSMAHEVLYYVIHAWIAPEADWAPPGGHGTARDALNEAIFRMHRHVRR